jgi:hypothetical protein
MNAARYFKYIVLTLGITLTACANTTVRHSTDYQTDLQRANKLLIMPAKAEVVTLDIANTSERMYGYELFVEDEVQKAIKSVLEEKGYRAEVFSKSQLKESKLYRKLDRVRSLYTNRRMSIRRIPNTNVEEATNIKQTIGEGAKPIYQQSKADIVILTNFEETIKTSGARARDYALDIAMAMIGGSGGQLSANAENAVLSIGVFDGKDGDVLWDHFALDVKDTFTSGFESLGQDEKDVTVRNIRSLVNKALKAFPNKDDLNKEA